jgi:hypothetical protein
MWYGVPVPKQAQVGLSPHRPGKLVQNAFEVFMTFGALGRTIEQPQTLGSNEMALFLLPR